MINWYLTSVPKQFNEERMSFQQNVLGQLDNHNAKEQSWIPYVTPYIKINSKWINEPNVRATIIKLFKENIDVNLFYLGLGNNFLYLTLKVKAISQKHK